MQYEASPAEAGQAQSATDAREICCSMTNVLLRLVRSKGGEAAARRLLGLPLAHVEESECQTRGEAQCLYTVTWDAERAAAAADPQQHVTSLEAQLVAMSERLQSCYATASDLVCTDELEAVLRRIVE